MKKLIYIILPVVLLLSSCTREEVLEDNVVEGKPVHIRVKVDDAELTRSGMSSSQEKAINNVFVMVFDKTGTKVSQSYFPSDVQSSLTNIPTVSGSNMSVYVVANLSLQNTGAVAVKDYFDNISTIDELKQSKLYDLASDLSVNRDLVMCGSATGLNISSVTTQNVSVPLSYAVAKVTLCVVKALTNGADSYDLTNWTVTNYPQKSNLFLNATDGVNPSNSSDFANSATSIAWVDTTLMVSGVSTPAKYAFMYMYENRRGTNSNTTETQKAGSAPAKATAIVVQGYYKSNATNTVTGVTTTVHLGRNNYNDYNVIRGNEYVHIMTVKGIDQINIDSRMSSNTSGYQLNIFNTTLDCHPDRRPVQLIAWADTYTLKILDELGNPATTGFWLKASSIDLNKAVLRSGSYQRPIYNPATDMVYSMLLNYTANPSSAPTNNMLYIYADENMTQTSRSGFVQVTSSAGELVKIPITQLGYQTMGNVGLRSFNVNGTINNADDYIIAIENNEEIAMKLTPGAAAGTESVTNMQWGFNNIASQPALDVSANNQHRNGFANTLIGVYGNITGALASTLIAPYGRSNTASVAANSVTTTEQLHDPIFNSYPSRYCFEKNRDLDGDGKITNPNTKGVKEISWYLPSTDEMVLAGMGQAAYSNHLNASVDYSNSSEMVGSSTYAQYYEPSTGISMALSKSTYLNARCIRKMYQTQPQATQNSPYVETGTRIINVTGFNAAVLRTTNLAIPTPLHNFASTIGQQISKRFVVGVKDCKLNGATGSIFSTWAEACGLTLASNSSATSFVIASPATGCQAYSETGAPAGTWRLPTQKELQVMFLMATELANQSGSGFTQFNFNNWYQSATFYNDTYSMICFYGTMRGTASATKVSGTPIRCIRDL